MPRPNITLADVTVPASQTPVQGFAQPCGGSYDTLIAVSQPYKGVDKWSLQIPARSGLIESPGTLAHLAAAVTAGVETQMLLDGHNPQLPAVLVTDLNQAAPAGVLKVADPASRAALQNMLDKATYYATVAGQLWTYWADEYQPTVLSEVLPPTSGPPRGVPHIQSQMPNWPLNVSAPGLVMPYCSGQPPGSVVQFDSPSGWRAKIACPSQLVTGLHQGDRDLFLQLVLASMLWARCAEETTTVVGLHYLNREEHESEVGGIVLGPPPAPDPVPPIADPGPQPPPPEPDPGPGPGDSQPPPPPDPDPDPGPHDLDPENAPEPEPDPDPELEPAPEPAAAPAFMAQKSWIEKYGGWVLGGLAVATVGYVGYQASQREP